MWQKAYAKDTVQWGKVLNFRKSSKLQEKVLISGRKLLIPGGRARSGNAELFPIRAALDLELFLQLGTFPETTEELRTFLEISTSHTVRIFLPFLIFLGFIFFVGPGSRSMQCVGGAF